MYLTFKNLHLHKHHIKIDIVDPLEYLISNGKRGIEKTEIKNPMANIEYITAEIDSLSDNYVRNYIKNQSHILVKLKQDIQGFLHRHPDFLENKNNYYTKFAIPKRKKDEHGRTKWRHLINPHPELKALQRNIVTTLQDLLNILPHNAAHAFRKNRSFYTNAQVHQNNKHIINLDLKDFFDSITEDIVRNALRLQPIFNVDPLGFELIDLIVKIATLDGTTPQGSPISPFLSNLVLLPFDYKMRQTLNNREIKTLYTRYADDMTFSSKKSQDISEIIHLVENLLNELYNGNIKLNYKKTKKLTPGRCFITGVKLNKDNQLTVGWEKKKLIKSRIYNLNYTISKDLTEEEQLLALDEAYSILGYIAFMYNVEPGYVNYLYIKYKNELNTIEEFIKN